MSQKFYEKAYSKLMEFGMGTIIDEDKDYIITLEGKQPFILGFKPKIMSIDKSKIEITNHFIKRKLIRYCIIYIEGDKVMVKKAIS